MSRFTHVTGNTFFIDGAVNIGVIKNPVDPERSIIIDSGLDDDSGRRIMKSMRENGLGVGSIINTHSHADHCGGNSYIKARTEARIYAAPFEKAIIENPELEPFYLYSAFPMKELDVRFLKAKPSKVDNEIALGKLAIEGIELEIHALPGHMCGMIGAATGDNVIFLGDAVFSTDIINKYGLLYMVDVKNALNTLEYIKTLKYDYYIPCHGSVLDDPVPELEANKEAIYKVVDVIQNTCAEAKDREQVIAELVKVYNIKLSIPQYYLTASTASAYLSYMSNEGILMTVFEDNRLKWKRA